MNAELKKRLDACLLKSGPFTDHSIDSVLLPELLAWMDGDWERLRVLLNYVHDAGQMRALDISRDKLRDYEFLVSHRIRTVWERGLTGEGGQAEASDG